jgi:hypothetical protein
MTVAAAADYPVGARCARHALPYIIRSKNRGVPIAPMVKDRRFFARIFAKDNESQKIFVLKFRITKPKIGHTLREGQKKSKKFLTFSDLCATMMAEGQRKSKSECERAQDQ